jgi:hypothetical protein
MHPDALLAIRPAPTQNERNLPTRRTGGPILKRAHVWGLTKIFVKDPEEIEARNDCAGEDQQ